MVRKFCYNLYRYFRSSSYIYNNRVKFYVSVVTLSTQDNSKLLPQLKNGFKRTITWNKYLAKPELLAQNENDDQRTSNKRYYIPNVKIKDYNVMIDGKNLFDQPIKKL